MKNHTEAELNSMAKSIEAAHLALGVERNMAAVPNYHVVMHKGSYYLAPSATGGTYALGTTSAKAMESMRHMHNSARMVLGL